MVSNRMRIKLRKIGNSLGVILPADVLQTLQVGAGDSLSLLPNEVGTGYRLTADNAEFERQMDIARGLLQRYRSTLRELAR